ncbi:NAD(P)/FAD-dependent oxidoreductase [Kushneria aurantia]|uniref:NAD(P)/FAD-dependent oxidoreductase n=1 Tax=Kushneria aurantia TaxID=504092 RepID=A0ABV6G074_9GAMM|nr:FAD-dependent oxidoreductase [Kushneria aurantia]
MTMLRQGSRAIDKLVIIGHGMASQRLLERLAERDERPRHIHVFGDEARPAYNRILLSPLLAGEIDENGIALRDAEWFAQHDIRLHSGRRIERIDRQTRCVTDNCGEHWHYDRLVIATGSRARFFDLPGAALAGIHGFRTTADVDTLLAASGCGRRAVVIGGGLLGLEAAEGLRKRGMTVTLVHRARHLMNRQLDAQAAELLSAELARRGLELRLGCQPTAFEGDGERVDGVLLDSGERLPAALVVTAAGILPNAEPGLAAGLAGERAIAVDDTLTTSDTHIHALGECCEFEGTTFGLVEPIHAQVEVLAERLCGGDARYALGDCATQLKISGIDLYAFGVLDPEAGDEVLRYVDIEAGDYRRLILRHGVLVGGVLYGDTRDGPWYFHQAQRRRDLRACRDTLLFGAHDASQQLEEAA